MDPILINKYQINFQNKITNLGNGNVILKIPLTNNVITNLLFDWTADDLNKYLIPQVQEIINGVSNEYQTGSEGITVLIDPTYATFYFDESSSSQTKLPIRDFFQIVIGWRDFLLQPN